MAKLTQEQKDAKAAAKAAQEQENEQLGEDTVLKIGEEEEEEEEEDEDDESEEETPTIPAPKQDKPKKAKAAAAQAAAAPPKKVVAHGMSAEELDELKYKQNYEEEIDMVEAKNGEDPEYEIPAHEAHLAHIRLEAKVFSQQSGEKLSRPRIQKFYPAELGAMLGRNALRGYTVEMLHISDKGLQELNRAKQAEEKRNKPRTEE